MDATTAEKMPANTNNLPTRILKGIGNTLLFLLGLTYLPLELVQIFEFDTSLAEISLIEIAFLVLLGSFLVSYYEGGRQRQYGWWMLSFRLFSAIGWLMLLAITIWVALIGYFGESFIYEPGTETIGNLIFRISVLSVISYITAPATDKDGQSNGNSQLSKEGDSA